MITRSAAAASAAAPADANDENASPNKCNDRRPIRHTKKSDGPARQAAGGRKVAKLAAMFDAASPQPPTSRSPMRPSAKRAAGNTLAKSAMSNRGKGVKCTDGKKEKDMAVQSTNARKNKDVSEGKRRMLLMQQHSSKNLDERQKPASIDTKFSIKDVSGKDNALSPISSPMLGRELFEGVSERALCGHHACLQSPADTTKTTASKSSPASSNEVSASSLRIVSEVSLLVLALYEVQHYYHYSPEATVFGVISEITGGSYAFHMCFVASFSFRALMISLAWARGLSSKIAGGRRVLRILQSTLLFVFFACCWMALIPLFRDCGPEASFASRFTIFFEMSSKHTKGKAAGKMISVGRPRYSFLDLLAMEWYRMTKFFVRSKIKGRVRKEIKRMLWRPFAIHGKLKKLFTLLRWAKFIGPLVGTCNKFRGHILDMIKKRRQRIKSQAAQKRWDHLLDALSKHSKLERAALKLQKRFRENRESKAKRRFALMSESRETSNGRVAQQIRRRLVEEQKMSRSKLERMDMIDSERKIRRQVSQDERTSIVKHKESERRLKKRLLISPKTSFAVGWKYLTVTCVALEISQIIFAPILSGELKKMPLDTFLLKVLHASSRCSDEGAKKEVPSIFVPVINNLSDITCATSPLRQTWLVTAHIIATVLVPIVQTVFFLDVFITFFTGELTSAGTLVPKPFVARYLVPGVGLQLIVNPTMVEISGLVKRAAAQSVYIGPSLCFHLLLACVPFAVCCYHCVLDIIFNFVERQNKIVSKR